MTDERSLVSIRGLVVPNRAPGLDIGWGASQGPAASRASGRAGRGVCSDADRGGELP
jgi:hypothetical protein